VVVKTRIITSVLMLMLMLIFLPILSSALEQFLEVYRSDISLIPENFLLKTALSIRTYTDFFTKVNPVNIFFWGILALFTIYSLFGLSHLKLEKKYIQKDGYGSHGTSRFQSPGEIKKHYFKNNLGWFLGSNTAGLKYFIGMPGAYHPIGGSLNMQALVLGSPGSFKTTSFVIPNIFHIPYMYRDLDEKGDIIITDPKSEIYCLTSKYLAGCGYDVYVLDFINLKHGDSLNPINYISTGKELMEIAEGYISSVADSTIISYSSDTFWEESEGQLLGALVGFVKKIYPADQQTFGEVLKILTSENVRDPKKAVKLFTDYSIGGTALQLWDNFLLAEDKVRANVLIGLATKLKLFSIKGIKNITGKTTIDIKKIGAKKNRPIALFILMPDKDRTFSPIINSIVTTILNQLYKTAYEYGNTLYSPTFLILEEMANIGRIPNIQVMLGTMRSRRIYPMLIWQSLPQMKNRYKDCWEDILSMCDTHLYLGINDDFTAQYCSRFLGNTTIKIQGVGISTGGYLETARQSESQNYSTRSLMLPDECKRLCQSRLILNQRSFYPSLLYKVQYRYWEEDTRICGISNVRDLPEIKSA